MENSEQQSVENGQKDLNSRNAPEFCKESLDSNKTPTIVENTAPDDPTSQNMIPIPQIINVLPVNEAFEEQTNTTGDDQNPMNFSEFWNETIESNNSANMNENQVTVAPSPLLCFNNIRYNKKMFGITACIIVVVFLFVIINIPSNGRITSMTESQTNLTFLDNDNFLLLSYWEEWKSDLFFIFNLTCKIVTVIFEGMIIFYIARHAPKKRPINKLILIDEVRFCVSITRTCLNQTY